MVGLIYRCDGYFLPLKDLVAHGHSRDGCTCTVIQTASVRHSMRRVDPGPGSWQQRLRLPRGITGGTIKLLRSTTD